MDGDGGRAFDEFVAISSPRLLRAAYLMCGDWGFAEDLLQDALVKTWLRWSKLEHQSAAESYTRTVLLRVVIRASKRRWTGERSTETLPDRVGTDEHARYDERDRVMRALATLPVRVRAMVVLRFFEDMTEAQIATAMDCPLGTVKSSLSRGLAVLRQSEGVAS
ncbi:MAG: SigE family RNA polymerase sigma factor [Frankiaceae bacterium]|nr:SigE family RNA polymerase sigma factor [Frankiaceae bacterium]